MKNLLNISIIILILTTFTTLAISAEVKRNRGNNKLGITKITAEERENSFMHKFINDELNFLNESDDTKASKIELDEIRDEVEKLKAQKINNIDILALSSTNINVGNTSHTIVLKSQVLKIESAADSGDFFSITTAANGATTIATVDNNAAAANLTLDIDGIISFKNNL
mgnify:CR=1 FL=1